MTVVNKGELPHAQGRLAEVLSDRSSLMEKRRNLQLICALHVGQGGVFGMFTEILGAFIGSKIDQQDGDSGLKGAVLGYVTPRVAGAVVKVGAFAVIGYGAVKGVQILRRYNGDRARPGLKKGI
jgi:hypothetical protein